MYHKIEGIFLYLPCTNAEVAKPIL